MFWCKASILDDFRVGEWELEKHLMRKATQGNRGQTITLIYMKAVV